MKDKFYKNYLKKAFVLLLVFLLAMPLASVAEIKSYTEQEASEILTKKKEISATITGWFNTGGKWYYYIDGIKQYGWLYLDDGTYYLDPNENGARVSGRQKIRGRFYYFNSNNSDRMYSGWTLFFGDVYRYYQANGVMATGLALADGVMHYFDANGYWKGRAQGWVQDNGKWYFYVNGLKEKGRIFNAGNYYFLDKTTGEMRTSWIKDGEDWYFAFDNGTLATNVTDLGGSTHFFKSYGLWIGTNGWKNKDGKWYYYINGSKVWGNVYIGESSYYFDEADDCAMATGLRTIEGEIYYFGDSGRKVRSTIVDFGGGVKYYFNWAGEGRRTLGWVFENGAWYFKWADGTVETDSIYIDGNYYRFDGGSGRMLTGWHESPHIGGVYCYSLPSGVMLMNTMREIEGAMYYFSGGGEAYAAQGWIQQNGKWYFYADGKAQTGMLELNGVFYFLNDDGSMHTGWKDKDNIDNSEYYKESGALARNETLVIDGVSYKFNDGGHLIINGWAKKVYSNGTFSWMYFDNGYAVSGWLDLNGVKYYLGKWHDMYVGWNDIDTGLYYFTPSGSMVSGTVWVEGKLCVFDSDGLFNDYYKGWREENGKWYYYKNGERHIGWLELGTNWYYMFSDGEMAVGTVNAGGVMHVFDSNGVWQHAL